MEILTKSKKTPKVPDLCEPQLIYIDEKRKRIEEQDFRRVLDRLNVAYNLYSQLVPEDPILSIEDLQAVQRDPVNRFTSFIYARNEKQENPFQKYIVEGGFSIEKIKSELIRLPDGFNEVVKACRHVEPNWNPRYFAIQDQRVVLSDLVVNRLINKVYFFIDKPIQLKRWNYAKDVLRQFMAWEELLREEAKEAGVKDVKLEACINKRLYTGPIPYCLRLEEDKGALSFQINHKWVCTGHLEYAEQIGLRSLQPDIKFKDPDPIRYKMFYRTDFDGGRRPYLVVKGQEKNLNGLAQDPLRMHPTTFEKGDFVFVNGKLQKIDEEESVK